LKFGVQIDYGECCSKNTKLGDKRISSIFQEWRKLQTSKSCQWDDGNLKSEPPSWSRGRAHSGRRQRREFRAPKLNIWQSILLAILFKNVLKMLKISQTGGGLSPSSSPLPAWGLLRRSGIE